MSILTSVEEIDALYGPIAPASTVKEADRITDEYRRLIEASPFAVLATAGPEGLDCSPRGDRPGSLVRIVDDRTVQIPDRRGNNRADSLRNIVRDPRVALLFLIPGSGTTLRINGRAVVDTDPDLCQSFAVDGKAPRSVVVVTAEAVYFQCARAVIRADLWNPASHVDPKALPTPGKILAALSRGEEGGDRYDREWPAKAAQTMW